jgi:hypothetical protein
MPKSMEKLPVIKMNGLSFKAMQKSVFELLAKPPCDDQEYKAMQLEKFIETLNIKRVSPKVDSGDQIFKNLLPEQTSTNIHEFIREKFDAIDMASKLKEQTPETYCDINIHNDDEFNKMVDKLFIQSFRTPTVVKAFIDYVYHHVFTDKMRNQFIITDESLTPEEKNEKLIDIFQTNYEKKSSVLDKYFSSKNFDDFWKIVWMSDTVSDEFEKFKKLNGELKKKATDEYISHFLGLETSSESDDTIKIEDRKGYLGSIYKKVHKVKASPKKKDIVKDVSKSEKAKLNAKKNVDSLLPVTTDVVHIKQDTTLVDEPIKKNEQHDASNTELVLEEKLTKAKRTLDKTQKKFDEETNDAAKEKLGKQLKKAQRLYDEAQKAVNDFKNDENEKSDEDDNINLEDA